MPFVDAPVLGTKAPAEQGALTVLASGPDDVHERCAPVFDAVGVEDRVAGRGRHRHARQARAQPLGAVR